MIRTWSGSALAPAVVLLVPGCGSDSFSVAPALSRAAEDEVVSVRGAAAPERELVSLVGSRHAQWLSARAPQLSGSVGAARSRAVVALPELAHEPFSLLDPRSGQNISVRMSETREVAHSDLGAVRVFEGAAGPGTALMYRAGQHGLEDFVRFAQPPAVAAVEYRVELGAGLAGLRLVERTLELLDASGTPRFRVAPPYVVGADGRVTPAEIAVLDCAVDESAAPPWGRAPRDPGAAECGVRVSWEDSGVSYPALLDPVWSTAASMAEPRESFASVALADGRVLVAGGLSDLSGVRTASAELYDPASDTWSVTGSLSETRSAFTLTSTDGGVLAVGGATPEADLSSTELYDAAEGLWSPGPALPFASAGHAAARLTSGAVVIAGGTAGTQAAVLAPDGAQWALAGTLIVDAPGASLTALGDGSAVLIGPGVPGAQRYVPDANNWFHGGMPALPRSEHTATLLTDGTVLVVGGALPGSSRSVELYDPAAQTFTFSGATNEPRFRHTATLLSDGRVAVVGGALLDGAVGTEIYNPTWGTWTSGPGTSQGRTAHQAALLADGRLLAIGGTAPEGEVLASADRLDATLAPTAISEYKLPARLDRDITASTVTELWASITRPATLVEGRRYPLLMFLHGNHATCGTGENPRSDSDCTYTTNGFCPDGFVVVPSHRGYDYVSTELAARGFIVVSVNANRGITCGGGEEGDFGFNLARGKLLLKHMQQLSEWNRGVSDTPESVGVSLEGKLDFTQFGMMGHSRGGEGVRAAYEQFRDSGSPWPRRIAEPVVFRALYEIGPVDGQTSRVLNADSTVWNVLLPMCDGDVSDLQGVKPFDRMLALRSEQRETAKSTYVAWGTNHNYFNTEWQQSDAFGCTDHRALFSDGPGITGSAEQRQVGLRSMLTFFLANVGVAKNTVLNELFDPTSPLETDTRVDRAYTPSLRPNRGFTLEDFTGPTGLTSRGLPTRAQNVSVDHGFVPEHDDSLRAAHIQWSFDPGSGAERFFEVPFTALAAGIDASRYTHLEFRVGRFSADDLTAATPLLVQLVNADGSLSEPLDAAAYNVRLDGPVGGFSPHLVLQSARLRLTHFGAATRGALRGVRFSFPTDAGAELFLTSVRLSLGSATLSPVQATGVPGGGASGVRPEAPAGESPGGSSQVRPGVRPQVLRQVAVEGNQQVALRPIDSRRVELELQTQVPFRAQNDQLVLEIGEQRSVRSRHPDGSLTRVVFTLDAPAFVALQNGQRMRIRYASNDAREWDFGTLDRSLLSP